MSANRILENEALLGLVSGGAVPGTDGARAVAADVAEGHTNHVVRIRFDDGRVLMVKQGLHDWAAARFDAARQAASLLSEAGVRAPVHVDIPGLDEIPTLAYWRIQLPTLRESWQAVPRHRRCNVVRSWGEMLRQAHSVDLSGHGPIEDAEAGGLRFHEHLRSDLRDRLLPAVIATWPPGIPLVERLLEWLDDLAVGTAASPPTVVHGDMHMGNVLCEVEGDEVRCVGLIDLESAWAGPAEADLASAVVMHTPLFAQKRPHPEFESRLMEGYGDEADDEAASYFRCYHLVNIGFFSALIGQGRHATKCGRAAERELATVAA